MSLPLKNDLIRINRFFLGFFKYLMENQETAKEWCRLGMIVGIKIQDLNLGYTINCLPQEIEIDSGYPKNPDVGISFTSDTFHDLFIGKINATMSLALGEIRTSGPTKNILRIARILPKTYAVYEEFLKESEFI